MVVVLRPTANNLFFTLLSSTGQPVFWFSVGCSGLKGPRRSTPLGCEQAAKQLADRLVDRKVRRVVVRVDGPLSSRIRSALKGLVHSGAIGVDRLELLPPTAHNGLRPPKRRRVL